MSFKNPENWLFLKRVVRFGDTDSAGVIHFHQLLRWSHEAWEESLEQYGIKACDVFPSTKQRASKCPIALPITHCEADFFLPIYSGDTLVVRLCPQRINLYSFEVKVEFQRENKTVAIGLLRHCAINAVTRQKCDIPINIDNWLEDSL